MNFTNEELEFLDARYAPASVAFALDTHWVLYCGVLVLLMQAGFAMLCAGSIRAKNAQNILLKNLLDLCVGALSFWATGYAFAYGGPGDGSRGSRFVGSRHFFLSDGFEGAESHGFRSWFFQFAFAATAATIVSGAVAERCHLRAYAGYSAALTALVSVWKSTSVSGTLSHFSATTWPRWLRRAVRNRHRHAIEQAARR